jgi:hypothetical protein
VTVVGSFALLYFGPIHAQRSADLLNYWAVRFPDWTRPWTVPGWTLLALAELCRYCCKPWGQPLAILAVIGAVWFWRTGRRREVLLLVGSVAAAFLAACLRAYPVGGHRLMAYAIPSVVLLIAAGAGPTLAWWNRRSRFAALVLGLFLLTPCTESVRRLFHPWDRPDVRSASEYILAHRRPGETVTGTTWESVYLFRRLGEEFQFPCDQCEPALDRLGLIPESARPLRYALHQADHLPPGERLWVMVNAEAPGSREGLEASARKSGWAVREATEFHQVWVLLLERAEERRDQITSTRLAPSAGR